MNKFIAFAHHNWYLVLAFALILILLIINELKNKVSGVASVSPQNLVNQINRDDAIVVDIRDKGGYISGHIINAIHIPKASFESSLAKLEKYKAKPVVISCSSGQQAPAVAGVLRKNGFDDVYFLRGGVAAWRQANLPLKKG